MSLQLVNTHNYKIKYNNSKISLTKKNAFYRFHFSIIIVYVHLHNDVNMPYTILHIPLSIILIFNVSVFFDNTDISKTYLVKGEFSMLNLVKAARHKFDVANMIISGW